MMNVTMANGSEVTTGSLKTFSEAPQSEQPTSEDGDSIVTSLEPTTLIASVGNQSTVVTVQVKATTEPTTSKECFQFKQLKWTSDYIKTLMVLLTVILCGAFLVVCLLLGWTTSVVYLKSRHRKRLRQLMEAYQDSRSKVYRSEKMLFTPLEAWPQDMEYQGNTSQGSLYPRVKRVSMALEGETLQSMGLTTFNRPSSGEVSDTSQLYTQSQSSLSNFPRSPELVYQHASPCVANHSKLNH
ncbi:hypothetical protein TcWFU_004622 [Taenia crassiceps]|uniref:Uncharacterized protein n=1 Tax=Taenia crassiceps TaxID=6207 RepID=A0ABR4QB42_9CEST